MLKRKVVSVANSILLVVSVILLICYLSILIGTSNYNEDYSQENQFGSILGETLKDIINCTNKNYDQELYQSGSFWILKNFVRAEHGPINCYESITYTTQSDVNYIDHLIPVIQRLVSYPTFKVTHLVNIKSIFFITYGMAEKLLCDSVCLPVFCEY